MFLYPNCVLKSAKQLVILTTGFNKPGVYYHQILHNVLKKKLVKMRSVRCVSFSWTFYFLSYFVCLISWGLGVANSEFCPHPSVPYAATYTNVTGGPSRSSWTVKYVCDRGYTLFGEETRLCKDSEWKGSLPMCLVNVALHKPASASSVTNGGKPGNAVDGKTNTVHEGKKLMKSSS